MITNINDVIYYFIVLMDIIKKQRKSEFSNGLLAYLLNGAPEPTRTAGLNLRRVALYPTELRAQIGAQGEI